MRLLILAPLLLIGQAMPAAAQTETDPGFAGVGTGNASAEVDQGSITVDADVTTPGAPGSEGTVDQAAEGIEPAPEGEWITVSDMLFADPPCVRTSRVFIEDVTPDEAREIERSRENLFVVEYEAHLSSGPPPPPCPTPDGEGIPGVDPTEAVEFADSAVERLPSAAPTISGGKAITGLRSWLDLGRESAFAADKTLDLGPFSRTATMTATATATVDWGDGTVTTHTSRGGAYHEGEPGPDDIVHTYTDAADGNVLTVTDTWEVVVSVPGLQDITMTWQAPAATLTFDIDEVRSARDR